MPTAPHLHLGVDLSDTGAQPAAWRTHGSRAQRLFDLETLVEHVETAQRGTLDFVVFDERFTLHTSRNTTLQGRLDPALVAARLAPRTRGIGLVAHVDAGYTPPEQVAQAVATIDRTSGGRAAWQAAGSRAIDDVVRAWGERSPDVPRPVDGRDDRYVTVEGVHFTRTRPAGAARPPQGRPPVVVRLDDVGTEAAGRSADVVRVRTTDLAEAVDLRRRVRDAAVAHDRDADAVRVLVDALLVLGPDRASAQARIELLHAIEGVRAEEGALAAAGTAVDVASLVTDWYAQGAADGFVLRPASLHTDLPGLADAVVPRLRCAGVFRERYASGATLRAHLGLTRTVRRVAGRAGTSARTAATR